MTQDERNIRVVRDAYAAFLRGDIAALLAMLDEEVDWLGVYGAGPQVPNSGARRGRQAVAGFFEQVAASYTFSRFEPSQFVATGDTVVALGHYTATTVRGTGIDSDFAMVFTVRDGRIARFREFCDSAAINAAFAESAVAVG
jgi:ketosteroid isomerase-like protein